MPNDARSTGSGRTDARMDRVRRIVATKGATAPEYWEQHGRRRFERELRADGVDEDEAAAFLDELGRELDDMWLEQILEDLRARYVAAPAYNRPSRQYGK